MPYVLIYSRLHGSGLPVFPKVVYSYFQDPNPDDVIDEITKEDLVDMEGKIYTTIACQEFSRNLKCALYK